MQRVKTLSNIELNRNNKDKLSIFIETHTKYSENTHCAKCKKKIGIKDPLYLALDMKFCSIICRKPSYDSALSSTKLYYN